MIKRENLTKENFWDEIGPKYPLAMQHFLMWIDEYKACYWPDLFHRDVKYHELPLSFQLGMFMAYIEMLPASIILIDCFDFGFYKLTLEQTFATLEDAIKYGRVKL